MEEGEFELFRDDFNEISKTLNDNLVRMTDNNIRSTGDVIAEIGEVKDSIGEISNSINGISEILERKYISDAQKEIHVIEKRSDGNIYYNNTKVHIPLHEILSNTGGNIVSTANSKEGDIIWIIERNKRRKIKK
jgi:hypothetical protein